MSDWDDEDFDIKDDFAPPPGESDAVKPVEKVEPKAKPAAPAKKAPVFAMDDLSKELTAAERQLLQERSDRELAKDLCGFSGEENSSTPSYDEIAKKEEFDLWGERVGDFLLKRHKSTHYNELVLRLVTTITKNYTPQEFHKLKNHVQQLSEAKKTAEKKEKAAATTAASTQSKKNKNQKAQIKVTKATNNDLYDDYGDDFDDYDDDLY